MTHTLLTEWTVKPPQLASVPHRGDNEVPPDSSGLSHTAQPTLGSSCRVRALSVSTHISHPAHTNMLLLLLTLSYVGLLEIGVMALEALVEVEV